MLTWISVLPLSVSADQKKNSFDYGSNIDVYSLESTSAKVTINIIKKYSGVIMYGTDPNNLTMKEKPIYKVGSRHFFQLLNLQPNTTYYYKFDLVKKSKIVSSQVYSFTTQAEQLQIMDTKTYSTSSTFTKFETFTNQEANMEIYYGVEKTNLDQQAVVVQTGGTQHLAYADKLLPNTTYYYQVVVKDKYGNYIKSDVYEFVTTI